MEIGAMEVGGLSRGGPGRRGTEWWKRFKVDVIDERFD
jgi:hypothetical protein